jgi:hypothetical protein
VELVKAALVTRFQLAIDPTVGRWNNPLSVAARTTPGLFGSIVTLLIRVSPRLVASRLQVPGGMPNADPEVLVASGANVDLVGGRCDAESNGK